MGELKGVLTLCAYLSLFDAPNPTQTFCRLQFSCAAVSCAVALYFINHMQHASLTLCSHSQLSSAQSC